MAVTSPLVLAHVKETINVWMATSAVLARVQRNLTQEQFVQLSTNASLDSVLMEFVVILLVTIRFELNLLLGKLLILAP